MSNDVLALRATDVGEGHLDEHRGVWLSGPCVALEHDFEVVLPLDGDFVEVLEPMLRGFMCKNASDTGRGRYELHRVEGQHQPYELSFNGRRIASGAEGHHFTLVLSGHINRSVIASSRSRYVLMHSACVRSSGVTVILPADQECGKTTTTAGLLRRGYDYITDEAVALDPESGWVTPFPKTLSLDPGSWGLFPELRRQHQRPWRHQWHVPAEHLGSRTLREPVPAPTVILFPRFVAGASTELQSVSAAEAVHELCQMTFFFPEAPGRNLQTLARVAQQAKSARLVIGSLDAATDIIGQLVDSNRKEEL